MKRDEVLAIIGGHVTMDRDKKFCASFRSILEGPDYKRGIMMRSRLLSHYSLR